jgi:hypothetical protein
MTAKSGIDMLEEILSYVKTLEKRLNVIDNNIKAIANSANLAKIINKASGTSLDGWAKATKPVMKVEEKNKEGFKNFNFQSVDAAKVGQGQVLADKTSRAKPTNIMVKGKLKIEKNGQTIPLPSAAVTIYNEQDKVVKKTKTNRAGHWMSQLAPGKYVALFEGEIDGKKLLPQNRNFEVPTTLPEGKNEFEVV